MSWIPGTPKEVKTLDKISYDLKDSLQAWIDSVDDGEWDNSCYAEIEYSVARMIRAILKFAKDFGMLHIIRREMPYDQRQY